MNQNIYRIFAHVSLRSAMVFGAEAIYLKDCFVAKIAPRNDTIFSANAKVVIYKKLFLLVIAWFIFAGTLLAEEITFTASVETNQMPLGATGQLTVTIKGTDDNIQAIPIPAVEGLQIKTTGSFSNSLTVNGRTSIARNFLYTIYPSKVGQFQIPALTANISGKSYSTQPISIEVIPEPILNDENQSSAVATSMNDKIFLKMSVPQRDFYLKEPIPLSIKLYVNNLNVRDIQLKELKQDGFQKVENLKAKQYTQIVSGVRYEVVEFTTTIYPMQEGDLVLGPAKLNCNILYEASSSDDPFFGSFFRNYDSRPIDVSSPPINIKVVSLPQDGKPQNFSGAVGQFQFEASVGPQEVKVGDPLTLKMRLSGQGNLKAAEFPRINDSRFKTYDPQVKQDDSLKVLEQVIIPTIEGIKEVPALEFIFFDTALKQYQTIKQGPFPVTVKPADNEQGFKAVEFNKPIEAKIDEQLGQDLIFIKERMGQVSSAGIYLYQQFSFWLLIFIYMALVVGLFVYYQIKYRMKTDERFARRIKAPRQARQGMADAKKVLNSAQTKEFYTVLSKTLRNYLGNKFHQPSASLNFERIQLLLETKKIKKDYIDHVRDIFEHADMARFASVGLDQDVMNEDLKKLQNIIEHLEDEL